MDAAQIQLTLKMGKISFDVLVRRLPPLGPVGDGWTVDVKQADVVALWIGKSTRVEVARPAVPPVASASSVVISECVPAALMVRGRHFSRKRAELIFADGKEVPRPGKCDAI